MSKKLIPADNLTDLDLNNKNNIVLTDSKQTANIADLALKQTVSNHCLYQDKSGKSGSSPKGLIMQINKRVKSHFKHSVDEMSIDELELLISLRNAIVRIIMDGESNEILRKDIKKKIYATIEKYGQLIAGLKEVLAS